MILEPNQPKKVIIKELWDNPEQIKLHFDVFNIIVSPDNHLETDIIINK